jgi:glycosyltransferase involved in cell wall biosynthesis
VYGARVMDLEPGPDPTADPQPALQFEPFDRQRLESWNFIDLGVLAHKRQLPEAHFDESLPALLDWDLVLRLTLAQAPMALPVVASMYHVSAPHRISDGPALIALGDSVRAKVARRSPLRVLAYTSLYPLVQETYIPDEMKAFTDHGATLAWCTDTWSPSPAGVDEPLYTDLDVAVSTFAPDVLVVFWADFAEGAIERLNRAGVPFALRVHSFDFSEAVVKRVQAHPLCVGVWAYPHHAQRIPGASTLVPLVTSADQIPTPDAIRPVILSASAGLPKKDWPMLVEAFARLARQGADCRVVVGLTATYEDEPGVIKTLIRQTGAPVKLSVDIPHDQMLALLARTAVVVYTLVAGGPFGMPRSIVEGMLAQTSVLLPDRPEAPLVAGASVRTYRTADDIVRHCTEILAGGPRIDAERRANQRFAESEFAAPELAATFVAQVASALTNWQDRFRS